MSMTHENCQWPRGEFHIECLVELLRNSFPAAPLPKPFAVVSLDIGDDCGRERVANLLSKPWMDVSILDIRACGPDLLYHLSPQGMLYYLPAFLFILLAGREFGWFEEALIPGEGGYEDVAEEFGGDVMYGARTDSSLRYGSRVDFVKNKLTTMQCECVAQYIEIAETFYKKRVDDEFLELLEKYANFWRSSCC